MLFCNVCGFVHGRTGFLHAVSWSKLRRGFLVDIEDCRTSAGLYYFSAKLSPPKYSPLASWITGWANVTGQVTLVCGIDFTCAQMITTAIAVSSDGATILSSGATFGILLAILFSHGIVCSSATRVLARLNLFYVFINGKPLTLSFKFWIRLILFAVGTSIAAIVALLVLSDGKRASTSDAFTLFENNSGWTSSMSLLHS